MYPTSAAQIVEVCSDFEKRGQLIKHLEKISSARDRAPSAARADDLTKYLSSVNTAGLHALAIRGDKQRSSRSVADNKGGQDRDEGKGKKK
ncbi:ATP-dependent RNA helicase dbp2 [Rhodosporidiobolus nylandii]